jgi:DNA-binding MarR family transcriptional regulator
MLDQGAAGGPGGSRFGRLQSAVDKAPADSKFPAGTVIASAGSMIDYYQAETLSAHRSVGYLLRRATSLMQARAEAIFTERDITFMQWVVLMHLRDRLACTAAEICRSAGHDSGALTRIIDQLEARALLQRRRSCEDRRVVELRLTGRGRETVEAMIPPMVDCMNAALNGFTAEEADRMIQLLNKFVAGLLPAGANESIGEAGLSGAPR